nr:disintegrin and metalloproteinase domain-containing protein 10-like [Chelonoidis abingdonii]
MVLVGAIILFFSLAAGGGGQYGNPLNKYIKHYEGLSYDVDSLHQKHQRAKRAVLHEDQFLHLNFHAHGRSEIGENKLHVQEIQVRIKVNLPTVIFTCPGSANPVDSHSVCHPHPLTPTLHRFCKN